MKIRLLTTGFKSAYENMAIDESVLLHAQKSHQATLRFYGWQPAAISIGYFQSLKEEVDLDECQKQQVDYIRRVTGGGAVFHQAEVTYSLIAPVDGQFIPQDIISSYKKICQGIIEGLKNLGIESQFVPLNDITSSGKKISGNAQTRKKNVLLQHGTVLLDVDVEKMFSLLKVPQEKMRDKLIKDVKQRVIGVRGLLGKKIEFESCQEALIKGFKKALKLEYEKTPLTASELAMVQELKDNKYTRSEWNLMR
ncbi:MAG: biotin/lipoate A/B protein ligase family protein [Patescibacteria group bacterium]